MFKRHLHEGMQQAIMTVSNLGETLPNDLELATLSLAPSRGLVWFTLCTLCFLVPRAKLERPYPGGLCCSIVLASSVTCEQVEPSAAIAG